MADDDFGVDTGGAVSASTPMDNSTGLPVAELSDAQKRTYERLSRVGIAGTNQGEPRMGEENRQRLEEILNHITYRFAPERGVTASYIALILDVNGVTAPAGTNQGPTDD